MRTVTVCVSAGPVSPSESVARTETAGLAGPSGNVHWKLDAVTEPATSSPPSPHDASIDWTVSWPGSETENAYVYAAGPSSTLRTLPAASVAVGATLRTVTVCVPAGPVSPSESVARTETCGVAGPSGNVQAKLVAVSEPATFTPPSPHDVSIAVIVSSPGSLTVNAYVCCAGPSSTLTSLALESVTVGATLRTVTAWVSAGPVSPSESVAPADTVLLAGPSGNVQAKLVEVSLPATFVPPAPQEVAVALTVSSPGSWTENVYVCGAGPSSTVRSFVAASVTVGATLRTATSWVAGALLAPSESATTMRTVVVAGPSGNTHEKLVGVSALGTTVPPVPHEIEVTAIPSSPGSLLVNV